MKKKAVKKGKVVKAAAKKKGLSAKAAKATGNKKMPLGKKLF